MRARPESTKVITTKRRRKAPGRTQPALKQMGYKSFRLWISLLDIDACQGRKFRTASKARCGKLSLRTKGLRAASSKTSLKTPSLSEGQLLPLRIISKQGR